MYWAIDNYIVRCFCDCGKTINPRIENYCPECGRNIDKEYLNKQYLEAVASFNCSVVKTIVQR